MRRLLLPLTVALLLVAVAAADAKVLAGSDAGYRLRMDTRTGKATLRVPQGVPAQPPDVFVVYCSRTANRRGGAVAGFARVKPRRTVRTAGRPFSARRTHCRIMRNVDATVARMRLR